MCKSAAKLLQRCNHYRSSIRTVRLTPPPPRLHLSLDDFDESFLDRIAELKDIGPPTTHHPTASILTIESASWIKRSGILAGNISWIITTSALLVALPLALSLEDEVKVITQEKEAMEQ